MAKIEVPPENRFGKQAQIHLDIQSALQDLVTHFNRQHDTIVSQLDPKQAAQYTQWWNNLSTCIGQHADLHEQLALHLKNAGQSYYQLDGEITTSFTPKP
jgi:Ca2+-binding RTX toxin-like protein